MPPLALLGASLPWDPLGDVQVFFKYANVDSGYGQFVVFSNTTFIVIPVAKKWSVDTDVSIGGPLTVIVQDKNCFLVVIHEVT